MRVSPVSRGPVSPEAAMSVTLPGVASIPDCITEMDWAHGRRELGLALGAPANLGWQCSDRLCTIGLAHATAMIWEDAAGRERRFDYDDLRLLSNAMAADLRG